MWGGISGLFWFIFPWWLRTLNISLSASQPFNIPLLWILCLILYPIFWLGCLVFLVINFLSSLYNSHISPLSDVGLVKIFFPICRLLICLTLPYRSFFSFMRSHLSIIDLRAGVIVVLFGKLFPIAINSKLFPTLSSIWVYPFYVEAFDTLGLEFYAGNKYGSICFVYIQTSSYTRTICGRSFLFSIV